MFDPTPESFTRTLRKRYKNLWARIRDRRFKTPDFRCEICGSDRRRRDWLDAHEVHAFPRPGLVKLEKIIFVCKHCHEAIHLERTRRMSGPKWVAEVEAHYCKVNQVTRKQLEKDFHALMMRSKDLRIRYGRTQPEMDYGDYQAEADLSEGRKRKPFFIDTGVA